MDWGPAIQATRRDGFEKLYASSSRVRVSGLRVRVESSLGLQVQVESRQCEIAKKSIIFLKKQNIEKLSNFLSKFLKIWTREIGCEFQVCASLQNRQRNCEFASSSPDSNPSLPGTCSRGQRP